MFVYMICFLLSIVLLIRVLTYGKVVDISMILLIIAVAIGNGGFFALASSQNLQEAILANTISYVIGIFAPIIVFHIICSICRIRIPGALSLTAYIIQMIIYVSLFTVGKTPLFYRTVEFHADPPAYLTKTYGPMHTAYLISLIFYTLASLITGLVSLERKTVVSRTNVIILVFVNMLGVGVYILERLTHVKTELMPVFYVFAFMVLMVPLLRVYRYSVYNNQDIFRQQISKTGYIVFDMKLRYMGCSEYAVTLFPELSTWELEKKIPGSGGRFNTFLRQPLMKYEKDETGAEVLRSSYEYKSEIYSYEISCLYSSGKRARGYIIQVNCITDAVVGESV